MSSAPPPPPPPSAVPPPPPPPPPGGFGYGYASSGPGLGTQGVPPGVELSSKGKRFGAWLLDVLLIFVTLFIGWLIWSLIIWKKGQTPAKQILNMRVLNLKTGRGATWGTMALREIVGRWLLGLVPFYTLASAIVLLVDKRNQALWDKIASTVVVEDPDGRLAP